MDQKDKKEIVKMFGEVLEQNVLPALDSFREETKKEFGKVGSQLEDVENRLDSVDNRLSRVERKLDRAIDRYDNKIDNHEKRLVNLENSVSN